MKCHAIFAIPFEFLGNWAAFDGEPETVRTKKSFNSIQFSASDF